MRTWAVYAGLMWSRHGRSSSLSAAPRQVVKLLSTATSRAVAPTLRRLGCSTVAHPDRSIVRSSMRRWFG